MASIDSDGYWIGEGRVKTETERTTLMGAHGQNLETETSALVGAHGQNLETETSALVRAHGQNLETRLLRWRGHTVKTWKQRGLHW